MRNFLERNVATIGQLQRYIHDILEITPQIFGQPHVDIKSTLAFKYLSGITDADAGFNDILHIIYVKPVRCDCFTVYLNIIVRLSTALFEQEIVGTLNIIQNG